jgi:hypothetical protein
MRSAAQAQQYDGSMLGAPCPGAPSAMPRHHAGRPLGPRARLLAVMCGVWAPTAYATTVQVDNTAELVSAVQSADAGGVDTIQLGVADYAPTATLSLTRAVTIRGPSTRGAQIAGSALPAGDDLFSVGAGASVTFVGVALDEVGYENQGAAIDVMSSGSAEVDNTSIAGTGGPSLLVEDGATATATNSTFSDGLEEGILDQGTVRLMNVTVGENSVEGIDDRGGSLTLVNTIVAGNGVDCARSADSTDASLDGDGSCGVGALSHVNAMLGRFTWNGGPTYSQVPQTGSPALAGGDPSQCPTVDQRFALRPSASCDIGAVQADVTPPGSPAPSVSQPVQTTSSTPTPTPAAAPTTPTAGARSDTSPTPAVTGVTGLGTLHGKGGRAITFRVDTRLGTAGGTFSYRDVAAHVWFRDARVTAVVVSVTRGTVTLMGVAREVLGGGSEHFAVTVSERGAIRTLRLRIPDGYDGGGRLWRGTLSETRRESSSR